MTKKKAAEKKLVKLDLACGDNKAEGFIGVDYKKTKSVDKVVDLDKYPWPWQNNSVDEINCSHYIEHTKDIIKFMEECCRILKKGGKLTIIAPYYSSMRAWQDPTHVRAISEASFFYYNKKWREDNKLDHYGINADFDFGYGYYFHPEVVSRPDEWKQFAIRHYINVVTDIRIDLVKR